jgi:adenosylhomocysteine nucleosidase
MKTLVCFAVKEEAGPFRRLAGERSECAILVTGMGKRNATEAVRRSLEQARPELVLTCGLAGGLNPAFATGTVIFPDDTQLELSTCLRALGARPARILCADTVATTVAEKARLRASTAADAVEMESQAIHAVCREKGIRCATVRVVLDTATEDLPLDFNRLLNDRQELDPAKLAMTLLKNPGKIPALMRLQKQTRAAAEALAEVLVNLLFERDPALKTDGAVE